MKAVYELCFFCGCIDVHIIYYHIIMHPMLVMWWTRNVIWAVKSVWGIYSSCFYSQKFVVWLIALFYQSYWWLITRSHAFVLTFMQLYIVWNTSKSETVSVDKFELVGGIVIFYFGHSNLVNITRFTFYFGHLYLASIIK